MIPPEVEAAGETQVVPRSEGGPWVGESGCSETYTPGAMAVQAWIEAYWPQVIHIGGYSCRPINGDETRMSVHATGRALDLHIPLDGEEADNDLGDPLANYLIEHAEEIGIQRIIWDRWFWRSDPPTHGMYTGAHDHHDHLHIELSEPAANMETTWFDGPMGPPDLGVCGDAVGAHAIIDDTSPCFERFGPSMFWREVDGVGEGGRIFWTNAFENDTPSNWARWRFHVAADAQYRVEVSSVADHAVHTAVRYEVFGASGRREVVIDPSGIDGWNDLGLHDFRVGEEAWVAVYDNYGPVPADQNITVDAIQLTSTTASPDGGVVSDGGGMTDAGVDDGGGADAGRRMSGGGGGCSAAGSSHGAWLALLLIRRRRLS